MRDAETLRDTASLPRYVQILLILRDRIREGNHPVGSVLPTENDLCAEFNVSRYTIREALRRLSDLGLVRRRQGSGTHVVATTPAQVYVHASSAFSETFDYPADTHYDVSDLSERTLGFEDAEATGMPAGSTWICAEGVRRDDSQTPVCRTRMYVDPRFAGVMREAGPEPVHVQIEERYGETIAEVVQDISAGPASSEDAAVFGIDPGALAVRTARRYVNTSGETVLAVVNWHPAESFQHSMRLRREER